MMLTFRNLLITHVHIEASMGGAGAKVTEVIAEWFPLRIRFYRTKLANSAFGARGRSSAAGMMKKPVRTLY